MRLLGAELVCLAVAHVLLSARSEHHWLRLCYARCQWHLFLYMSNSPATTSDSRPPRRCWPRWRSSLPGSARFTSHLNPHAGRHLASAADAEDLEFRRAPPPVEKIVVPGLGTVVVFLPEPLCPHVPAHG